MNNSDKHLESYRSDGVAKDRYSFGDKAYYLGKFVTDNTPSGGKHLSIGCNSGVIAKLLSRKDKYIKGIEVY
jgi:tRNA1(Val) A37 N6-methylase TrmN6